MLNSFQVQGRFARDVDLRYTAGEKPLAVARFTLAIQRNMADRKAYFVQFQAFGKVAENIERYFKKGSEIIVEGEIQSGQYQKEGETIYTQSLVVERFNFCGKKEADAGIAPENSFSEIGEEVDLPF